MWFFFAQHLCSTIKGTYKKQSSIFPFESAHQTQITNSVYTQSNQRSIFVSLCRRSFSNAGRVQNQNNKPVRLDSRNSSRYMCRFDGALRSAFYYISHFLFSLFCARHLSLYVFCMCLCVCVCVCVWVSEVNLSLTLTLASLSVRTNWLNYIRFVKVLANLSGAPAGVMYK